VGVFVGTYSSICIASSIAFSFMKKKGSKEELK